MPLPIVAPLPPPPNRQQAAGSFSQSADTFMDALPAFGGQINVVAEFVDQRAAAAASSAQAAIDNGAIQIEVTTTKAAAAAASATTATQQATSAKTQADNALTYRDSAQVAAAAAQAAAGLPALAGKGGLPLMPKRDGTGVEYSGSIKRYDLDSVTTTAALDLSVSQVFRVDASVARTLVFSNVPAATKAMTVVVHLTGAAAITWPAGILWNNSVAPILGLTWTTVILLWVGTGWVGSLGAKS